MEILQSLKTYNAGLVQGKAYRILSAHLTKALLAYGVSIPEWKLLGQLADHGNLKLATLAELLSVEAPLVTALVDKLEKKAFVERANDPQDRRAKVISITPAGKQLVKQAESAVRASMKNLLKGVSLGELKTYMKVLSTIVKNG